MILGLFLTASVITAIQINAEEKQTAETQQTETAGLPAETNAEVIASGTCGDNLTWELNVDGTLSINGTGKMDDAKGISSAPWYSYRESIKKVVIADGVESIGNYVFYNCTKLIRISIPDGVQYIGKWAFYNCTSLVSVTIPEGVTSIYDNTFYENRSLIDVTIPESVTTIEKYAFFGCRSLTTISLPSKLTCINEGVFTNCYTLKNITIPEKVTLIGKSAFYGCEVLTEIQIPEGVTKIDDQAFRDCVELESVTLPDSLTIIGGMAFFGCYSLTNLQIPKNVNVIMDAAFRRCSSLSNITIPEGVTSLNSAVFSECTSLSAVTIPKSVVDIDQYVFSECVNLKNVYYNSCPKDWSLVAINNRENEYLTRATMHYSNLEIKNWNWSDDYSKASVDFLCKKHKTIESSLDAEISIKELQTPTCENAGRVSYTGTILYENQEYTNTVETTTPAIGHNYTTVKYVWSEDYSVVSATAVCANDNSHVVTETVRTNSEETIPVTCEKDGLRTYTALFTKSPFTTQTKTETIPATGHEYVIAEWIWSDDFSFTSAKFTCKNNSSHTQYAEATITMQTTAPTCETTGKKVFTAKAAFDGKEYTDTKEQIIPAIGHKYGTPTYEWDGLKKVTATAVCANDNSHVVTETVRTNSEETIPVTCEKDGLRTYTALFTKSLFTIQTKTETIQATGHDFGKPEYSWSDDNKTATATIVCKNDPSHIEEETVNAAVTFTREATCTEAGEVVYTASFQNTAFETQTKTAEIPALGHNYEFRGWEWSDDYYTAKVKLECSVCHEVVYAIGFVEKTETPATCETDGSIVYTVSTVYHDTEYTDTKTVVIPATGHNYGEPEYLWSSDNKTVTAKRVCRNDPSHVDSETVKTTYKVTVQPGCETEGEGTYTASFTNKAFTAQTKTVVIPATGHKYGTSTYTWNGYKVTAKAVCEHDSAHVVTETVTATSKVTTEPTCEKEGVRTYTATFKNSMFKTQTKTESIPAIGHQYGTPEYTWSSDNKTVTATVTCTNDKSHKITETVNTTYKVTKEATETAEGTGTYTASFKNSLFKTQTKNVTIPKKTPAVKTVEMYRLYNPNSGEHFYTAKAKERDVLASIGWQYEGIGWYAPAESSTPVYRLYNKNAGDHHYTMKAKERDALVKVGWDYEGIGWYSDDNEEVPLYRQYNPYAVSGSHNYTTNKKENDALVKIGWIAEGIGWYGVKN